MRKHASHQACVVFGAVKGSSPMETTTVEQVTLPRLNEPAPDFDALTTHGRKKLSDYTDAGKWVLLFSHPADFTPVCTTEFMAFAQLEPKLARNVQLIGLSIDSIHFPSRLGPGYRAESRRPRFLPDHR